MKKVLVVLMVLLCSFGVFGCNQQTEVDKTINIGVMPDVESIPFLIAQKNGYFAHEGVNVNIEHFSSAKDRDSALQSGKLDGVITDIAAVLFANEGGIDLRIIARSDGNILLMAGKDAGVNTVIGLKDKDIGLSTNTIMEYTLDKMLEAHDLQDNEVSKIAIPPLPTRLEMLQGGKIDAAILPEPMAGLAVKNGAHVLTTTDQMDNKAGAIAFTSYSIKENTEEIKAVFRAYNQAVEYLQNEAADNYIDFIIEEQHFPDGIKDSLDLPYYHQAEIIREDVFSDVVDWMLKKDLIKNNYEFNDIVDQTILR